ncbi:MAG TPA: MFS transporter [Ilumatobacter sp.]|nr:MFS transporter [Ilumatobacter sp.]
MTAVDTAPDQPDTGSGLFGPAYRALTIGLVSIVTLVAFESLAVVTILPEVEADLGGLAWYGWVTTAFFLGTMIGIVFAGRQADRYGLARPYVAGLTLFAVGLLVGGLATSMPMLVVARVVQGFGAGVVPAVGYVAIGRFYPEATRPRMFAVLSTAWVVPGIAGPALSERIAHLTSWRWVFLGLLPLVIVAGSLIVPTMRRIGAPDAANGDDAAGRPWLRRPMVEAVRVAGGAALVVGGLTRGGWEVAPMVVAGVVVGVNPLRRLTPPGTLRSAPGLPATVLSRGMLMFAFYGVDAFVPYALTHGKHTSTFAGSIAVTASTLGWTSAVWVQQRHIVRTGEAFFIRIGYAVVAAGVATIAITAAAPDVPFWVIHIGATISGFGVGLAYSAHAQATLRVADPERYGAATASLQLCDNLGVALGAGLSGAVIAFGDGRGWAPGSGVGLAFVAPVAVAVVGVAFVARRLPPPAAPATPAVA